MAPGRTTNLANVASFDTNGSPLINDIPTLYLFDFFLPQQTTIDLDSVFVKSFLYLYPIIIIIIIITLFEKKNRKL